MRLFVFAVIVPALFLTALPAIAKRDFVAHPKDFKCLTDGVEVQGRLFRVFHKNHKLRNKAVALANAGATDGPFPVGTILQLFPFEAMAKRRQGFNPQGNDWEFFQLKITDKKTAILSRGKGEVANALGSCQGCHVRVAPTHDLVCEYIIGTAGLGLTDDTVRALQATDTRCAK